MCRDSINKTNNLTVGININCELFLHNIFRFPVK